MSRPKISNSSGHRQNFHCFDSTDLWDEMGRGKNEENLLSEIDLSVNSFWFAIYLLVSLNQVTFCLLSAYWPFSLCSWSLLLVDLRFIGYVANNICKKASFSATCLLFAVSTTNYIYRFRLMAHHFVQSS